MSAFLDPSAWQFWLGTVPGVPFALFVAFDFGRFVGDES